MSNEEEVAMPTPDDAKVQPMTEEEVERIRGELDSLLPGPWANERRRFLATIDQARAIAAKRLTDVVAAEDRMVAAEKDRDALAGALERIATAAEAGVSLVQALDAGVVKVEHPVRRMERIAQEARAALAARGKVKP